MAEEKDINLGDTLITIDDRHIKTYRYGELKIKEYVVNGERSFEIPRKNHNEYEIKLDDGEGRALYNILHDIYGRDEA